MATKQYNVIITNADNASAEQITNVLVNQGSGDRGQPVRIKAKGKTRYQLQELDRANKTAPEYVKVKRVGKDLHITFENDSLSDLIIEDYYDHQPADFDGLVGQAENGQMYSYVPEDPNPEGLVPMLVDGADGVDVALGAAEYSGALLAPVVDGGISPWLLGAAGLLAGGAIGAAIADQNKTSSSSTSAAPAAAPVATIDGDLAGPSDSGALGDHLTKDNTPTLVGHVPAGSSATVTINGQTYPVTVNPDGTWTFTQPTGLPDGTYTPILNVTQNGVTTPHNLTPFTIDTVPPTIAITADKTQLLAGQTTQVTFTLSEAASDFTLADVVVTGGTLSNFVQSPTNPLVYTATFTPTPGSTITSVIRVGNNEFSDKANNFNVDGADANNNLQIPTNTIVGAGTAYLGPVSDNTLGAPNDFKTNDPTPVLNGQVPAGSTATLSINGQTYPVAVNPDGTWTFTQPTNLPDGTYTPILTITPSGGGSPITTNGTPFTIDTVPPSVVVTSDHTTLSTGQKATVTFTLSEPVSDFTAADVTVTGGTLSNFQQSSTNPKVYTATFTPTANSTTPSVVSVASSKFSDAAGNLNTDGSEVNNTVTMTTNTTGPDTVAPTVAITADRTDLLTGQTAVLTFTLSEASANFTQGDVAVSGGSLSNWRQDPNNPLVYTATFTPYPNSTTPSSITVPGATFTDASNNNNTPSNTLTLPTNTTTGLVTGDLASISDTANPVDNLTADNTPTITGTAPPGAKVVVTINGVPYETIADPQGQYAVVVPPANTLPDGVYTPTITVTPQGSTTPNPPVNGTPFTIDTTTFVTISNPGTVGGLTPVTGTGEPGSTVTVKDSLGNVVGTAPVAADGTWTLTPSSPLPAGPVTALATDVAGNSATANATPTGGAATNGALAPVSDTGVMGDNTTNDPTPQLTGNVPPGSTAKVKINGQEYPVTVNPDGTWNFTQPNNLPDGTYTPELIVTPPGATTPNAPVPLTPFTIDTVPPTVFVQADKLQLLAGQTTQVTFTLSEAVSDFTLADVTVTGGTLSNFVKSATNPLVYTATFTPDANSTVTSVISVASGKFSDAANNFNTDGADVGATNTNTVSLPTNTNTGGGTAFLSPTSDSGVPGDNVTSDSTPTITGTVPPGSTAKVNVNGVDYPVTVNPDGTYSFTVPNNLPDGTYTPQLIITPPGSTTPNPAVPGTPFTIDTVAPTVVVTSDHTTLTTGQTATITFTLSEGSTDFAQTDVTVTGGTLSNFTKSATNPLVYTATFTPDTNSTVNGVVSVPSFKFTDAAGNFNADGSETNNTVTMTSNTRAPDTITPTIAITADRAALATGQTATITFTLSEASSDFTAADVTLSSGTLTNFAQSATNPLVYTATYTPAANSTAASVISVASDKFSDGAGNLNKDTYLSGVAGTTQEANNTVSLPTNTTPGLVSGGLAPSSDTGVPNDNKTLDNTPTISGTAPPGSAVDVVINGQHYPGVADENGQYSINVPNGLPDGTYTPQIIVTPPGSTTPNPAVPGTPFTIDTTPPTILVTSDKTTLTTGQTATITFTLNEASADFTIDDVAVTGGTLSNFVKSTTNPLVYTATFTPNTNSTTTSTIKVDSTKFSDVVGNFNVDGNDTGVTNTNIVSMATNTQLGDTTPPTIIVERTNIGSTLQTGATETITFTLSEASLDFTASDVTVAGGTLSNFTAIPTSGTAGTGYTQYTATFTPTANSSGTATVSVAAGKFTDNAGNTNLDTYTGSTDTVANHVIETNNQVSLAYNTTSANPVDNTAPKIAIARVGTGTLVSGATDTITFTLSEASMTFTLADVNVTGGTLTNFAPVVTSGNASTGYTEYTATFTPTANTLGTAQIGVINGKFTDAAGNLNQDTYLSGTAGTVLEANNLVEIAYNTTLADTTPPTIVVARSGTGTVTGPETIYFTLSEGSVNFALADIDVTGGTLSNFAPVASSTTANGYTQYTATFTPTSASTGVATIGVASSKFTDAANNNNLDTYVTGSANYETNNQVALSYNTTSTDTTPPTVAVSRAGTGVVGASEVITFTLSAPSTDFTLADVTVTGGTLSNFQGSGASYTATFTPTPNSTGTATVGVAAGTFHDASNNLNQDTYVSGTGYEANNIVAFAYDSILPTIAITSDHTTLLIGQTAIVTFTLSELSTDFTLADITVSGGTLGALTQDANNPLVYTATFTPNTNSIANSVISVASNKFSDAVGNFNVDGADANNTVTMLTNTNPSDTTPPTIIVDRTNAGTTIAAGATETITFTLSEASTNFSLADIDVVGGTLSNFTAIPTSGTAGTGYTQYTATFTPTASSSGTATISVAAGKFTDNAGNTNLDTYTGSTDTVANHVIETNNQVSIAYNTTPPDTTPPTVAVARAGTANLTVGGTETITFTLSELSKDFTLADINVSGGTLSNFAPVVTSGNASTGYTDYTATFTPTANTLGTAQIGVINGKFTDAAGNLNQDTYLSGTAGTVLEANNLVEITYNTTLPDTTPPTIVVARSGTGIISGTETIYFTLSEASTTFALTDVDVIGGTLSNFVAVPSSGTLVGGYTQYEATFTPSSNSSGTALIGVAAGKFSDMAATPNANVDTYVPGANYEANNQVSVPFNTVPPDTTAPTIAITRSGTGVVTTTETITFTLSEASTTFASGDVVVTGGAISGFAPVLTSGNSTTGYTEYTATFTPTAGVVGNASVAVASSAFTDAAGNANQDTYLPGANFELNNIVAFPFNTDTTPPTIAITRTGTNTVTTTDTITFTLSEASTDFTLADIDVTGGTLSNFQGSGTTYTATFTPSANTSGNATIGVLAGKFTDVANNFNKDTYTNPATGTDIYESNNLLTVPFNTDSTPPTVAIASSASNLTGASTATITFTLSEASTDFTQSDVDLVGGSLSNWTAVSSTVYTATFTPTANSSGTATVSIASDKFSDAAANLNKDTYLSGVTGTTQESDNQVTITYNTQAPDTTPPTIAIARSGTGTGTGVETITFTLSEASTDFALNDVVVSGGVLSNFTGSGTTYTATFTPTANTVGNALIAVASDKFTDAAGNFNKDTYLSGVTGTTQESNNQVAFAINTDTTPPTVIVTRAGTGTVGTAGDTITFTLSEASTDFTSADVDVTGGTLSNWTQVSATVYTALFTPGGNSVGTASVGVASDKFSDAATNVNKDTYLSGVAGTTQESNNQITFAYNTDSTPPTIAITRTGTNTVTTTDTITFTLSEASTDFTLADIDVTGGTLSNFQGSGTTYTATFTPTSNAVGTASVGVLAGKFSDAATNLNKDTYTNPATGTDIYESNNQITFAYNTDTTPPTIALSRAGTGTVSGTETITFTLSEPSVNFDATDVTLTGGGSFSNFAPVLSSGNSTTGYTQYTVTYTAPANSSGAVTVNVASNKFTDAAGNNNQDGAEANNTLNFNYITDTTPPTIAITRVGTGIVGAAGDTITFTLSEASTDFTQSDLTVTGGTLGTLTQSTTHPLEYTATFLPTAGTAGTINISVASNKFSDAAANFNVDGADANNAISLTWDTITPTIAVTRSGSATLAAGGTETITFTLSEASTDFTQADVTLSAGTLSNWTAVSATVYTATFTPPAGSGAATIGVTNSKFSDAVGNFNADNYVGATASEDLNNAVSVSYSTNVPTQTVTLSSMTKDSSMNAANADWTTNDASAGRLISGHISAPLTTGETVKVYANGVLIGDAVVNGTNWEITDLNSYVGSATWTYTAKVVDAVGNAGPVVTQVVTGDYTEAAPVITSLVDIANTTISATGGNTTSMIKTVSGTGIAGDTVWLYDNTADTLVGAAVVDVSGNWSVTGLQVGGASTFAARHVDMNGNISNFSNLFSVTSSDTTYTAPAADGSLVANGTGQGTSGSDTVNYAVNANTFLDTLGGNDTITATSTTLLADLMNNGGMINGGAGVDTLKLIAGTNLNLELLTNNQTVSSIQQIEIFRMQGGSSSLTMSANDVLSLGGSNATTMSTYTFASTSQIADGSTAATGSTSSTGKVQMVVRGLSGDQLNLDALANDGVTQNGQLGNSGLSGSWAYKGQVVIGGTAYKVYDHSTSGAQVLVDLPVSVRTITPVTIVSINDPTNGSVDSGTSTLDFITNDQTLIFMGQSPVDMVSGELVKVEILNSSNTAVLTSYVTPNGTNWTYDATQDTPLPNGNYTIKATIVDASLQTVLTYGSLGVATQPLVIDNQAPTIAITRATNNVLTTGSGTETVTFTLSEASTNFTLADIDVVGGALSNFSGSGTTYTATFTPTAGTSGTGTVGVLAGKFSDKAGNNNADTYLTGQGVNTQADNQVSIAYVTPPTQTVTFSSMTKDSGLPTSTTNNHDWLTNDGSAGRLVSGTLNAPLQAGQSVAVYANGTLIGNATVNAAGTAWEITDINGYTSGWTYTAKVVDLYGNNGPLTTQVVNGDFTEAAPVITSVTDSASASIANAGTTTNTLSTVSGTGNAGDTIYLYDNTGTNLVGTTTVAANGTWSISGLATNTAVGSGSNTFSARQIDVLGNESVLSNLWTVSSLGGGNSVVNGDFSGGNAGFTTSGVTYTTAMNHGSGANQYALMANAPTVDATLSTHRALTTTSNANLKWKTDYNATSDYTNVFLNNPNFYAGNPNGKMSGTVLEVNLGSGGTFWQETMSVVAGKTYTFEFDYLMNSFGTTAPRLTFDGVAISFTTNGYETGHFTATYTATATTTITASLYADNSGVGANNGDFRLDNVSFTPNTVVADGSLTAGGTPPFTSNADGSSTAITYTGGVADMLAGDDVLNIGTNAQTLLSTSGNLINGSTGVDTLKMAAGTSLNLETLTTNQTVKPIEQVEIFTMQGGSSLTLSANDVLSLGGANASTMSAYAFSSTSAGTNGIYTSTNKVQMVVHGTAGDILVLDPLKTDGVTTNGIVGNTALAGQWDYMGTTTANGATYKVYNQSTTGAQVLVDPAVNVITPDPVTVTKTATFSSMTKDSSLTTANADWLTNDASAGRLVSGTVSSALAADEQVQVYANGTLVGNATLNSARTAWEFTDLQGYNANWTYTALVVNTTSGKSGALTTQQVTLDNTEVAPVITGVTDSASAGVANAGTTANTLSTVSGTGTAGDTIYLYDNTGNNLVGTTTVAGNGTWSVTGLESNPLVGVGSNVFAVRQVDAQGNSSVLSNLYTVTSNGGTNLIANGDFSLGNQAFGSTQTYGASISVDSAVNAYTVTNNFFATGPDSYYQTAWNLSSTWPTNATSTPTAYGNGMGTWSTTYRGHSQSGYDYQGNQNPDLAMTGNMLIGTVNQNAQILWTQDVAVVAGQTYVFKFDYLNYNFTGTEMNATIDGQNIQFVTYDHQDGHFTATYTATTTKSMTLSVGASAGATAQGGWHNNYVLDNFSFMSATTPSDNTLVAGGTAPASGSDNATLSYTAGAVDAMAGNDVITATSSSIQAALSNGGQINGNAGIDTLKLAAGTVLNLETLTNNQTVKQIEQVEVFTMQGGSALTLSANDVLSLGGTNLGSSVGTSTAASPMAPYGFSATTQVAGATGSTTSLNKVQFVVQGTTADTLVLNGLQLDAVTTNGTVGNAGLTGQWDFKGTVVLTGVDGLSHTYKVYDQSTTKAQVLVDQSVNVIPEDPVVTKTASFSSMTKDSGVTSTSTINNNWITNDASAGRLVSGTVNTALASDEQVQIFANGTAVGFATLNSARIAWEFTDINGYNGSWIYTAQVVNTTSNKGGIVAVQQVNLDNFEAAPIITGITDSTNALIANNESAGQNTLSTISGTGNVGDTIYLYDNSGTNMVGTTTVGSDGKWSISGLASNPGVGSGTNTFSAKQVDAQGNTSVLSNLWTVTAPSAGLLNNGDFSAGNTGFNTTLNYVASNPISGVTNQYSIIDAGSLPAQVGGTTKITTGAPTTPVAYGNGLGTWSAQYGNGMGSPDGAFTGNVLVGQMSTGKYTIWKETVTVEAGKTYQFTFDYTSRVFTEPLSTTIDGVNIVFDAKPYTFMAGHFTATYVATVNKTFDLSIQGSNIELTSGGDGDWALDNVRFGLPAVPVDNTLVAGGASPFTPSPDGTATAITYTGGAADMLAGDDVLNIGINAQTLLSTSGNLINGSTGVDTLKMAAGTVLNLETLTNTQTVKPIEQVEIFTLQGGSALTLTANDVLSLGGANASTMSAYTFASSSGGTASTASTNKIQMVIHGTSSDTLVLDTLKTDGVTTNGTVGNTGLAGQWDYMGTTTANGATYKIYNQSTTGAQVLVDPAVTVILPDPTMVAKTVSFSSMTKDSSTTTANADWLTNDASAGRLVSGTVSAALASDEQVQVYANGTLVGNATLNATRTAWEFTDTQGYNANWTYTAVVVNTTSSKTGIPAIQQVSLDNTESAPVITGVTDSASASIANAGTTANTLSTVTGSGAAGDIIYLYDNSSNNLVGTTTVASNGTWSISGLATNGGVGSGSNTFSARQIDALGNESALSNLWTVNSTAGTNAIVNGDFAAAAGVGFTTTLGFLNGNPTTGQTTSLYNNADPTGSVTVTTVATPTVVPAATTYAFGNWTKDAVTTATNMANPDGTMSTRMLWGQLDSAVVETIWSENVSVVAGQSYTFKFDYFTNGFDTQGLTAVIDGASITVMAAQPVTSTTFEAGHFYVTYTATTTKTMTLALTGKHTVQNRGDFMLDNFSFTPSAPLLADGTLSAGGTPPFTSGVDGSSTAITYTGGVADMLAGDDVLNIGTNAQTLLGTAGNLINGSTGIDTLKLAAGTTLNLVSLTNNQTVKSIQQVEVFELQGTSSLTLSANDVLSLGMTNAFTSNGKVQFMVNGTGSDTVSLQNLLSDGVGGNTGLAGMWASAGTASYGGNTYNLYNHDTTGAQVWIKNTITSVSLATSPLVLDLNGDGIQTTALTQGVYFDLLNAGQAQKVSWIDSHDGLLAIDLNNDGLINTGAELLGTSTRLADGSLAKNGWEALAQYDLNQDGKIDANDAVFNKLNVWVDSDTDGFTDSGELKSLSELGIQSISLKHDATQLAQNGNILEGFSLFTTNDGATHQAVDAWLQTQQNPAFSFTSENVMQVLGANQNVDLTQMVANTQHVNSIDLTGAGNNSIKLSLNEVMSISTPLDNAMTAANDAKMLVINGNAGEVVNLVGGTQWTQVGVSMDGASLNGTYGATHQFIAGHQYDQYVLNNANLFIDHNLTKNNMAL